MEFDDKLLDMEFDDKLLKVFNKDMFIEAISDEMHSIWAHWMKYLFSVSIENQDGSVTIHSESVERWKRQMDTPYTLLTEQEKESDRDQAKKIERITHKQGMELLKRMNEVFDMEKIGSLMEKYEDEILHDELNEFTDGERERENMLGIWS